MSIKSELGEIVHCIINNQEIYVDVYDLEINGENVDAEGRIDSDGDLRITTKIDVEKIRTLWSDSEILDTFTREELLGWLDIEDSKVGE